MIYTDAIFIALFLVLWIATWLLRNHASVREWIIIIFSLAFIASWGEFSLGLLLTVAAANFVAVRLASTLPVYRKTIIAGAIVFDLAILAVFKYGGFAHSTLPFVPLIPAVGIPIAISFYTFHLISYLVDFGKGRVQPLPVRKYLFYLCFFPHVIAGPIVRTWQLVPQLGKVRRIPTDLAMGLHFVIVGYFLKAVIANNLADAIDPIWAGGADWSLSAVDRWATAFMYYCQIYSDFAGYTLMALGMARLLGYRLPPNFRAPMLAMTMQDFWRRWHRTLSFWLRDYLYFPLGGSRKGNARTAINLMITMLLGGLWHGAGWNFVIWGGMHGIGLAGERILGLRSIAAVTWKRLGWWFCTQIWVTLAWVFFRLGSFDDAAAFIRGMFRYVDNSSIVLHGTLLLPLLVAAGAIAHQLGAIWIPRVPRKHLGIYLGIATGVLLVVNVVAFSPNKVFIYFKF